MLHAYARPRLAGDIQQVTVLESVRVGNTTISLLHLTEGLSLSRTQHCAEGWKVKIDNGWHPPTGRIFRTQGDAVEYFARMQEGE
jgi:hypothetical protein